MNRIHGANCNKLITPDLICIFVSRGWSKQKTTNYISLWYYTPMQFTRGTAGDRRRLETSSLHTRFPMPPKWYIMMRTKFSKQNIHIIYSLLIHLHLLCCNALIVFITSAFAISTVGRVRLFNFECASRSYYNEIVIYHQNNLYVRRILRIVCDSCTVSVVRINHSLHLPAHRLPPPPPAVIA